MDQEPDLTDKPPEEIRQDIDDTRSRLTDKLESLEEQVRDTVQGARDSVEDTIESVKGTVHDTIRAVKRTFDLKYQTQKHPWGMFGGSLASGFILGSLLPTRARGHDARAGSPGSITEPQLGSRFLGNGHSPVSGEVEPASHRDTPSAMGNLLHRFDGEIGQLKELAIGAAAGLVRDWLKQALPPTLGPQLEHVMDSATSKLGGRPVPSPVVENFSSLLHPSRPEPHRSGYAEPV